MKHYNKTLLQLDHALDLSQTGTCTACHAAEFHGTKEYARQAVAKHRAISRDVRHSLDQLIKRLDAYDFRVEQAHHELVQKVIE